MIKPRLFAQTLVLLFLAFAAGARAQTPQVSTVNVTPEKNRVRVAAVGDAFDVKIEVVDEAGETVFEGTQVSDRALDWPLTDARGQRVRPGTFTVTVSYTTQAGKARKRIEQVVVTEEVQGAAEKGGEQKASSSAPDPQPLVDGGGAANRIPKFTDADTLTSSSIIDISGRVGIGTTAPAAGLRLDINGLTRMTTGGSGGYMQFGTPNGETGFGWIKSTSPASRADIRFNGTGVTLAAVTGVNVPPNTYGLFINTGGRVGVGTVTPTIGKLHVQGPAGVPAVYGESPNRGVWGKSTGSSYGVYGESGSGIGIQGVSTSNVGVVGVTSAACCETVGVYGYSSNGATTGVRGAGVTGVHGVTSQSTGTGVFGESTAGSGVWGRSTSGLGVQGRSSTTSTAGAGVGGYNDAGGWAMYAGGNAGQARTGGGWVKAMVIVNPDGTIARCFNSQKPDGGASLPPSGKTGCGFNVDGPVATSQYIINFGFLVSDRFLSVTPGFSGSALAGASLTYFSNSNSASVLTYVADGGDRAVAQFTVFVF